MRGAAAALALVMSLAAGAVATVATAQPAGFVPLPSSTGGVTIDEVTLEARGSTGDDRRDAEILAAVRRGLAFSPGQTFETPVFDTAVLRARRVSGVRNATYALLSRRNPESVVLSVTLDLAPGAASGSAGLLATGDAFPLLWRDERSLLAVTLNGGVGAFTDLNPWFRNAPAFTRGNPLVRDPATGAGTGRAASWMENAVEYGLAGAMQLGDTPFYAYGAISVATVTSAGRDIFRDDTRTTTGIEKGYGGLLYADPQGRFNASLSAGRQTFTLNDGFLISQFGSQSNAGPRPGVYLAPRTALDMAVLGQASWGPWTLRGFYLDPNEYEPLESHTTVAGTNLRYTVTPSFFADVTTYTVPRSESRYRTPTGATLPREGLTTLAGHVRWADRDVLDGVWLETELAHQTSTAFRMDAWAGYATAGYLARDIRWTPSLSYRLSYFSGDDPATGTFERFDPLYSGGLSEWLQGISLNKLLTPANRFSHRVRANVSPVSGLDLTLDWFVHRADRLDNRGGNPALAQLSSDDLGQEVQATLRWAVNRHVYVLGIVGHAVPGRAMKDATPTGAAKPWSTVQGQVFWTF
ncbi:MAG: alginate export family protein [Burkholderiales bacterium]|nr:alginate export family protein [Burkholderiales bacterium]